MSFDGARAIIIIDRRAGLVFLAIGVPVPESLDVQKPAATLRRSSRIGRERSVPRADK